MGQGLHHSRADADRRQDREEPADVPLVLRGAYLVSLPPRCS